MFDSLMTRDGTRLNPLAYLFLALLCVGFFAPGLATLPPTDRDESSFAQATKQMIETGNYVDIRLQDQPRYQKPIGIYWLQAASVRLLDRAHLNEIWAYRIPSAISATVAVLMTAAIGSLLFSPLIGILAGLMMAGCVSLNVEAHLAKTDATLLACITVMQYGLAQAYKKVPSPSRGGLGREGSDREINAPGLEQISRPHSPSPDPSREGKGVFFAFWLALGLGILIKGPIILLVLCGTLLWLRVTEKQLTWFRSLRPLAGIALVLLITAPWFVAIMLASHGLFIQKSAGNDMLAKLWQGQGRGIMPPGMHLLVLPAMFFPFSIFAMLGGIDAWHRRTEPSVRFCLGWILPTWAVFEISLTKLPHYVLPTYPAIALLATVGLLDGYPRLVLANRRWLLALTVTVWLLVGTAFAVLFTLAPACLDNTFSWPQAVAGLLLMLSQGVALYLVLRGRRPAAVATLSLGALIFLPLVFSTTLPSLQHLWLSREIVRTAEAVSPCKQWRIVAAGYGEPSLVFMAGTGTLLTPDATLAASTLRADRCRIAVVDDKHKAAFLAAFADAVPPRELGSIAGLNTGLGKQRPLFLYAQGAP